MYELLRNRASLRLRSLMLMVSAATLFSIWGCGGGNGNNAQPTAAKAGPKNFASPDDAGKSLSDAAKSGNQEAVASIFGAGSKDLISTGNAADDKASAFRICPSIPGDEPMAETGRRQ